MKIWKRHRILATCVLALSVAAVAAPTASADPWFIDSSGAITPAGIVRPDDRAVRATPVTIVVPEGSFDRATPPDDRPVNVTPVEATPITSSAPVRPDDRSAIRGPGAAPVPVTITVDGDGFDWGDAGIGAGMALGLVLLASGLLLYRHRRGPEIAAS
jgi:hypothetical protein